MAELDPYATLGVPRTASRAEIARAYRRLAKLHHPDAGASPSPQMARINEAWYTLSDPARRARWDRQHVVVAPPHWRPAGEPTAAPRTRRPAREPELAAGPADRGWVVATGVVIAALVIGGVMMIVSATSTPSDELAEFESDELSFSFPAAWEVVGGLPEESGRTHRVIASLATYPVAGDELCQQFQECAAPGGDVPAGEARLVITSWADAQPPLEPDPTLSIGGRPAARELARIDPDTILATWQLSPPGFPDRWIEVRAEMGGRRLDVESVLVEVAEVLDSIRFPDA